MDNNKGAIKATEIIKAFIGILLLFASLYGVYDYIDWRIEKKINNPEFIRMISSKVRPSVIFDSNGSIEIDMGAMYFIENLKIIPSDDPRFPKQIIVSPKAYSAHAPLLTTLDEVEFSVKVERGKKFDWVYNLSINKYFEEMKRTRFRFEIVK